MRDPATHKTIQMWMKRASIVSACAFLSAVVLCIGCSIHEQALWGLPQDATAYGLAIGTDVSILILMVAGTCALLCLHHLLSLDPEETKPRPDARWSKRG